MFNAWTFLGYILATRKPILDFLKVLQNHMGHIYMEPLPRRVKWLFYSNQSIQLPSGLLYLYFPEAQSPVGRKWGTKFLDHNHSRVLVSLMFALLLYLVHTGFFMAIHYHLTVIMCFSYSYLTRLSHPKMPSSKFTYNNLSGEALNPS